MGSGRAEEPPQPSPSLSQASLWEEEWSIREQTGCWNSSAAPSGLEPGCEQKGSPRGQAPSSQRLCRLWALSSTLTTSIWLVLGVQRVSIRLSWKTVIMAEETNQETLKIMNFTEKLCK